MGRKWTEWFDVKTTDGMLRVGYSLKKRGAVYLVQFRGPTGEYARQSTGETELGRARSEAARIVLRAYNPTAARGGKLTWDELDAKLEHALTANNNRHSTYIDYSKTLKAVRSLLPDTKSPLDITHEKAHQFKNLYLDTPYKRGKGKGATEYKRKPVSFNSALRSLRAIWHKWLDRTWRLTNANPWANVPPCEVDKGTPQAPPEETLAAFFRWLEVKYPGWALPAVFVALKCQLGCRLSDICSLRAEQVAGQHVTFDADQQKQRSGRKVKIPATLADQVRAVGGRVYLWDGYPDQLREHLRSRKLPARRIKPLFDVETFRSFAAGLFRDFQNETGHKLPSHSLRRRAITKLYEQDFTVDVAARMVGMTAQNARQYYLALDPLDTDPHFDKLGDGLLPPTVQQSRPPVQQTQGDPAPQ